jgi:L-alanine-DL-glutamate epimerase-like enolase superfamily enzyme
LPELTLRLDPDGGYTVKQAIDVTRALANAIEMIGEPTTPGDLESLGEVTTTARCR